MRIERADLTIDKGWLVGRWNSELDCSIGYATTGIDDPHVHNRIAEIYLVARGIAEIRIEHETLSLQAGDMLIVQPGEAHTFLSSSSDYFHFVLHSPGELGDKSPVSRERLGL